jgi:vacuolar protein 8
VVGITHLGHKSETNFSSDELKGSLLEMGICQVLIPLTNSASSEVQGNSAAAIGNLSSKDGRSATDDYSAFNDVWDTPEGGMHQYLYRFLCSPDATFQHIAVWTIVQLLESGGKSTTFEVPNLCLYRYIDAQLNSNIRNSPILVPTIRAMAASRPGSPGSSVGDGTLHSGRSRSRHSYQDTEEGQGEIQLLARRILEFTDGEGGDEGSTPVRTGSSVALAQGGEHDELRKSVRDAFSHGSYRSGH